jgi:hypothetical protein
MNRAIVHSLATVALMIVGSLRCMDGKVDSQAPRENYAIVKGVAQPFCRCQGARIVLHAAPSSGSFIRCDSNDDGRLDIADAIWIVNAQFYGGPPSPCRDAADCDGDGRASIADALYALDHEFQAGPPPSSPYPACGKGAGTTAESCPAASTRCR